MFPIPKCVSLQLSVDIFCSYSACIIMKKKYNIQLAVVVTSSVWHAYNLFVLFYLLWTDDCEESVTLARILRA